MLPNRYHFDGMKRALDEDSVSFHAKASAEMHGGPVIPQHKSDNPIMR
jgi:hypothetical protein